MTSGSGKGSVGEAFNGASLASALAAFEAGASTPETQGLSFSTHGKAYDVLAGLARAGIDLNSSSANTKNERRAQERKEEEKRAFEGRMYQILMDQINKTENALMERYGKNFAENILSDLAEKNLIEQEEYKAIMAIKDEDERRHAIAIAIQQGIIEGRISPSDIPNDPQVQEWLELHTEKKKQIQNEATQLLTGEINFKEASNDASREAATATLENAPNLAGQFEIAARTSNSGALEERKDIGLQTNLSNLDSFKGLS